MLIAVICQESDGGLEILLLTLSFVTPTRAPACSSEIEPQGAPIRPGIGLDGTHDNAIVHVSAIQGMRVGYNNRLIRGLPRHSALQGKALDL
jgi:hypothetical protein